MKLARATATVVLLLAVVAPSARAQSVDRTGDARPIRFGIAGGVVIPRTGGSTRELENGLHGQGFALLKLPGGLPALRLNVDYAHMRFAKPTAGTASSSAGTDGARTLLDGVAGVRLDLLHGPVRPYLLAGVGAFNVRDALTAAATSGGNAAALDRTMTSTNFGVDGGAGLAFKLGPVDGFLETRLQNVYTKQAGLIDTKSIQSFPVAFGITF